MMRKGIQGVNKPKRDSRAKDQSEDSSSGGPRLHPEAGRGEGPLVGLLTRNHQTSALQQGVRGRGGYILALGVGVIQDGVSSQETSLSVVWI